MVKYFTPKGGLFPQSRMPNDKAVFTNAYALIPQSVFSDIVCSYFPFWKETRAWVLARPLSGFAETFAQYIVEVAPNGGSDNPEPDKKAQAVLFVTSGELSLILDGKKHKMKAGGYAYISPKDKWSVKNESDKNVSFHWIRKKYHKVKGIKTPNSFVTNEQDIEPIYMPDTNEKWSTTRFVDSKDMSHDLHVNIVNFKGGGVIPFAETHVMEHGLFVLEGKAKYRLNDDWVDVSEGDFMWLRAFCPQACIVEEGNNFRYLLYKDVNRHHSLTI